MTTPAVSASLSASASGRWLPRASRGPPPVKGATRARRAAAFLPLPLLCRRAASGRAAPPHRRRRIQVSASPSRSRCAAAPRHPGRRWEDVDLRRRGVNVARSSNGGDFFLCLARHSSDPVAEGSKRQWVNPHRVWTPQTHPCGNNMTSRVSPYTITGGGISPDPYPDG
jgi:hypothetical protein